MTISINQAQAIVQKLSNEQLMQSYTNGSLPQFIVFTEMQRRQSMQKAAAQPPTQTVAESMVGSEEPEGIASVEEPQMAARGGITRVSPLTFSDVPESATKTLSMRFKQMRDLEDMEGS